jgi:hypothetical protein
MPCTYAMNFLSLINASTFFHAGEYKTNWHNQAESYQTYAVRNRHILSITDFLPVLAVLKIFNIIYMHTLKPLMRKSRSI